jgi:hypothetical protein
MTDRWRLRTAGPGDGPLWQRPPGSDTIGILLVDRSGRILAREHGGFDDEKAMRLTVALER